MRGSAAGRTSGAGRTIAALTAGALAVAVFSVGIFAGQTVADRRPDTPAAGALTVGGRHTADRGLDLSGPVDPASLDAALAAAGVTLPEGTNVYAAVVHDDAGDFHYDQFEAGGGAEADAFWPASSVKVLAAVGALEFLADLGFTGAATVAFDDGDSWTVRDLYQAAIAASSNEAYDRLVQIAGVDWLNSEFLTPENGFPSSVIQKSYVDLGPVVSPALTVTEGDRSVDVPERIPEADLGVPDDGNRSDLLEMTESVARIGLDAQLPDDERFAIDPSDITDLRASLLEADGFLRPGIVGALGPDVQVYDKPGYVVGADCVDVAFIDTADPSRSFLLGVSTPDDGADCSTLADVAQATLDFLAAKG